MNLATCFLATALLLTPTAAQEPNPILTSVKSKLKHPDQPFVMVVVLKVKAGKEAALKDAVAIAVKGTRKEKGNIAYRLHNDTDEPSTFVMYEHWKNLDALDVHIKADYTQKLLKDIGDLLDGAPSIKVYTVIAE